MTEKKYARTIRDATKYLCRFMIRDSSFLKFSASKMAAVALIAAMNAQSALFRHQAKQEDGKKTTHGEESKQSDEKASNASKAKIKKRRPSLDKEAKTRQNSPYKEEDRQVKKEFEPSSLNHKESSAMRQEPLEED